MYLLCPVASRNSVLVAVDGGNCKSCDGTVIDVRCRLSAHVNAHFKSWVVHASVICLSLISQCVFVVFRQPVCEAVVFLEL